jgi:ubiquinone/menaquinone biosynthesis C-methylase UbiE
MSQFSHRSIQKELMDDLNCSGPVLEQTLRELKTINKWLGGNYVTTNGLNKLIQKKQDQETYEVTDLGCGGGDMIRVMAQWAQKARISINFKGIDANRNIIELARVRQKDLENVQWEVGNVFDSDFSKRKTDLITCTLFTHHFTDQELVNILSAAREKSRIGIVINDLHRHPLAYHSIRLLTRFFSKSPMVRHDASLSVMRSFSKSDWERILGEAGIKNYQIHWFWAFRWQICIKF